ncbi:MAG: CinA family protein [Gammaproteobacteria bacterium]|nr:MAG: CinA family protein [Gammaproteobacteria bacterium]
MPECDDRYIPLVAALAERLTRRGEMLATAESCTGGWIAKVLTDRPGSSAWFDCGFVTYSNQAKEEMLGVPADVIAIHGAVSHETVVAMAAGALARSRASWSMAVSGIAGPGGGTPEKPVGTVWLAWGTPEGVGSACEHFPGDRNQVRAATVERALRGLLERL